MDYPDLAVKLFFPVMLMRSMKHILLFQVAILLSALSMMSQTMMSQTKLSSGCATSPSEIVASHVAGEVALDAQHPSPEWQKAQAAVFCSDWRGKNPDDGRATEVRVLWSSQTLYLRFECRYRELFVFEDSDSNGRRDHLWDRDVAEAFLQPDPSQERYYREFEERNEAICVSRPESAALDGGAGDSSEGPDYAV